MKLTFEEEIEVLQETRGLPTGQRCMRLGYPEITLKSLEERFAVHKLAEAQTKQEEERVFRELAERAGIHPTEARERFTIDTEGRVTDGERSRQLWDLMMATNAMADKRDSLAAMLRADTDSFWDMIPSRKGVPESVLMKPIRAGQSVASAIRGSALAGREQRLVRSVIDGLTMKKVTGFVKVDALDAYMEEAIPQRVLDSLEVAKEAGLKDFHVAYPCLKVEEVTLRQADPVLLAKLGERWLEIDYWE